MKQDPLYEEVSDEELAQWMANQTEIPEEPQEPPAGWWPSLTPKQMDVFTDTTPNLLVVGSRFSGKGFSTQALAARHAWDHHNALILVVTKTRRQALTGGWYSKFAAETLPEFAANIKGFSYEDPRTTAEKDLIIRVRNRFGTWSIVQLMSVHHENELAKKVRGLECSLVYVDELTSFSTPEIWEWLGNTLGRRNHIPPEAQRFVATCNPDSPDHWVHDLWYDKPFANGKDGDPAFRYIEVMGQDNPDPKCVEYYKRLRVTLRNNPVQYARDVEGKWVAMPSGDAIFKDSFVPDFHVRGNAATEEFLLPKTGVSVYIGLDAGDVNHGVCFLQERVTQDKIVWVAFDEIVYVSKKVGLRQLTIDIMARMQWWCEQMDHSFYFIPVSDNSAFNRFRAATGSFDYLKIEETSREVLSKYPRLKAPLKIVECPKPAGSVPARIRNLADLLSNESFFISAKCVNLIETLNKITAEKDKPFVPNTRDKLKHVLDACTYPLFYAGAGGSLITERMETRPQHTPQVLQIGS